jgi:hypothetical protein
VYTGNLLKGMKCEIMQFRIADTFTDSLARLTGEEQKGGLEKEGHILLSGIS